MMIQADVARQLGVTALAVTNWECNHADPAVHLIPRIVDFLGYVPFEEPKTLPEKIKAYRITRGLSQVGLAGLLGVDPSTVWRWEAGRDTMPALLKRFEALLNTSTDA